VGIAELSGAPKPSETVQRDERWVQVQLIGEIDRATGKFHRGVGSYPGLDDLVHFATAAHLTAIFPAPGPAHLRIGCLAGAEEVPVCLNAAKLVVGSTGSGKTSAVASILQGFIKGGWKAANIVVIDPHGEYAGALGESASVRSVLGEGDTKLRVPYWALPALDILNVFVGATGSPRFSKRFSELVGEARKRFVNDCSWLNLDPSAITADTPVPFDIRAVWHVIDSENRETRNNKNDPASAAACRTSPGNAQQLLSAVFTPYNQGGAAPHKGPLYDMYGVTPDLLRLGLLNPQLEFFQEPAGTVAGPDPLVDVLQEWLGKEKPVSVLDFSGVPAAAADLAIGVVLNLLFEVSTRSEKGGTGVGRASPVFIVLEEAHRYLGENASPLTKNSANKIAREGRNSGLDYCLLRNARPNCQKRH
jgi:uncharacterized protein